MVTKVVTNPKKEQNMQQHERFNDLKAYMKWLIETGKARSATEAKKVAMRRIPKESYFQGKILRYLNSKPLGLNVEAWKVQAGMYQVRGLPDIIAVVGGQFIGFEVKRPLVGEITPLQKAMAERIKAAGGRVYFVSYVSEVEEILKQLTRW